MQRFSFMMLLTASTVIFYASAQQISFMTPPWGAPPEEALQTFEDRSGIEVEVQSLPMDQLFTKVQTASVTNQAPADVVFLSEEAPSNIVTPGFMEPLNSYVDEDGSEIDFEDFERRDFWTVDGNIYGIPTYVQLVMMDYNAARLSEAGFEEPPTSWEELFEQARAVKAQGIDEYPLSFTGRSWSWYLMAQSLGGPLFTEDLEPNFNSESSVQAMKYLIDSYNEEELASPELLTKVTPHDDFLAGSGTFHQSWQGANVVMNNPEISQQAPNVNYMLIPGEHLTWGLDAAIGISKFSNNKDAAWEFIKWYVSPEVQEQIYTNVGLVPSRLSVQQDLGEQGEIAGYDVITEQSEYVSQLPRQVPWWGQFDSYVTEQIRRAITENSEPEAVTRALTDRWTELKQRYSGQ